MHDCKRKSIYIHHVATHRARAILKPFLLWIRLRPVPKIFARRRAFVDWNQVLPYCTHAHTHSDKNTRTAFTSPPTGRGKQEHACKLALTVQETQKLLEVDGLVAVHVARVPDLLEPLLVVEASVSQTSPQLLHTRTHAHAHTRTHVSMRAIFFS